VSPKPETDFVQCWRCNRGGRGNDKDLCSAGWQHNTPSSNGCYLGVPIVGEPRNPPRLTRGQLRYRSWLRIADVSDITFGNFLRREKGVSNGRR
jgi:hypothetical protein